MRYKKGSLGENRPSKDLLLTVNHPINDNGEERTGKYYLSRPEYEGKIVMETIPCSVMVYTLSFETRKTVKMHNIDVYQWAENDFNEFCKKHKVKQTTQGLYKELCP